MSSTWFGVLAGLLFLNLVSMGLFFWKLLRIDRKLGRVSIKINKSIEQSGRNLFRQFQAFLALKTHIGKTEKLPPLRGWAASPDFILEVVRLLEKYRPGLVVECGSGATTLAIATFLEEQGHGQLVSLEHEAHYQKETSQILEENGLEHRALVIHAPLSKYDIEGQSWFWYAFSSFPDKVDMVVVDGPPKTIQDLARYPAIPLLESYLAMDAVLALDDADRPEEQQIISRWQAEGAWRVTRRETEKGMAILERE